MEHWNLYNRTMSSPIRRKKDTYIKHLSRLQQLKSGKTNEQIRRNREQKKLAQAIEAMRKMHNYNRQYKQKERKEVEVETNKSRNINRVKSVVTTDFNWPIPTIAPKHKRNAKPILDENMKMFQRIIHAKSNVDSTNDNYTDRKNKNKYKAPLPSISTADFSKLYENSLIYEDYHQKIKLKFGKSKKYSKYHVKIDFQELFDTLKDLDSTYIIEAWFGSQKIRSQTFVLGQLETIGIIVKIGQQQFEEGRLTLKLIKILDYYEKKQICKAKLYCQINKNKPESSQKQNNNPSTRLNIEEQGLVEGKNETQKKRMQKYRKHGGKNRNLLFMQLENEKDLKFMSLTNSKIQRK